MLPRRFPSRRVAALPACLLATQCVADRTTAGDFISFVRVPKSYAVVDMSGALTVGSRPETYRKKSDRGPVSVTFMPIKPSKLPPAREAEITWPVFKHTAIVRSPKGLPVLAQVPYWHPRTHYPIRVNGKAVPFRAGRADQQVWLVQLPGGANEVTFFTTDAE